MHSLVRMEQIDAKKGFDFSPIYRGGIESFPIIIVVAIGAFQR